MVPATGVVYLQAKKRHAGKPGELEGRFKTTSLSLQKEHTLLIPWFQASDCQTKIECSSVVMNHQIYAIFFFMATIEN